MDKQEPKAAGSNQRAETEREKERDSFAEMKDILAVLPSYLKPHCAVLSRTDEENVLKITQDSVRDQFCIMFDQLDEVVSKKTSVKAEQLKSLHKWFRKFSGYFLHVTRFERVKILKRLKGETCGEMLKALVEALEKKCGFEKEMASITKLFKKLWVLPGVTHKLSSKWSTVLLEIVKRCHALATAVLDNMEMEMLLFARLVDRRHHLRPIFRAIRRKLMRSLWKTAGFKYNVPALVESVSKLAHRRNLIDATMSEAVRKLYYNKLQRQYGEKYVDGWKILAHHKRIVERADLFPRNGTQNIWETAMEL